MERQLGFPLMFGQSFYWNSPTKDFKVMRKKRRSRLSLFSLRPVPLLNKRTH
jgi:hypothetical protein